MPKRSRADSESPSPSPSPLVSSPPASALGHSAKYTHLERDEAPPQVMRCQLPPHAPLSFASYEEYDVHYKASHTNRCSECRKNFPTGHFLTLHIAENHDPLNEARRARGEKTYQCFVEDCDRFCSTPQKRKMHMIDKHKFPKFYDFFIVNDGIDKRTSMLRPGHHRRRSSAAAKAAANDQRNRQQSNGDSSKETNTNEESLTNDSPSVQSTNGKTGQAAHQNDSEMDDITDSMAALKFVPPSVKFGRGRGRGGFARS